jgi:hypothetical protein
VVVGVASAGVSIELSVGLGEWSMAPSVEVEDGLAESLPLPFPPNLLLVSDLVNNQKE